MSETVLTSPIILDATGQDMLTKLDAIISALTPNAQGVAYDKSGRHIITGENVQTALNQLDNSLNDTSASLTQLQDSKLEFITFTISSCSINANAKTYYTTAETFPSKSGYARRMLFITSNNENVVCTRYAVNNSNYVVVYFANLTSSTQTFNVTAIGLYINNNDIHNAT